MVNKQNGKKKPLKQPKKERESDNPDDIALKKKLQDEKKKLKEMQERAKGTKGFVK